LFAIRIMGLTRINIKTYIGPGEMSSWKPYVLGAKSVKLNIRSKRFTKGSNCPEVYEVLSVVPLGLVIDDFKKSFVRTIGLAIKISLY
jgi:hypothetical protein